MAEISDLSDELLVKILSFLPTKDAVSTSVLSKQWEFLWMWCPDLDFDCDKDSVKDFIDKNLPLYKAPFINSLCLHFGEYSIIEPETFESWFEVSISRCMRNLTIRRPVEYGYVVDIPSSLYTCNSLVTLELQGSLILLDVPRKACLTSLKKLHISEVTYSTKDSLPQLLCCCPVLEDLLINRHHEDYLEALVIKVPSLQRLSLFIDEGCSVDGCVIVTPCLKYFKICDERTYSYSHSIEHMPELEEADISLPVDSDWEDLLKSISTVKRLSLVVLVRHGNETLYGDGNVFSKLENLKLAIWGENWSKVTFHLLKDSPNLQVLDLELRERSGFYEAASDDETSSDDEAFGDDKPVGWISDQSLVPECLLSSLKTFKFKFRGCTKEVEARDILCFINKHACRLESPPIMC